MRIQKDVSLAKLNTFGVDVNATSVLTFENGDDFSNTNIGGYLKAKSFLILGRGSNILFTKDYPGNIILMKNSGKEILHEDQDSVTVKVNAGHNWDKFVKWSIDNNLVGLHNLALIPGTCGATPIQNVGAYGVEVKEYITEVEIFNTESFGKEIVTNSKCKFGYRDSIFKNELKEKAIVTSVTFKLKKFKGDIDEKYLKYSGIKEALDGKDLTPRTLYECIVNIRNEKLPKVEEYGSCGSTFKNPEISISEYERLLLKFPQLPKFDTDREGIVKIPAAHILEKLGWKNKRSGDVGTWIYHPLIVTNYGNATGEEILSFIKDLQSDFKSETNLDLECEINII